MLKNLSFALVGISLVSVVQVAKADQCAWMDASEQPASNQRFVVESARLLLRPGVEFIEYCAPCSDGQPGTIQRVGERSVDFARASYPGVTRVYNGTNGVPAYLSLKIDGKDVDLAYIYVRTGSRVFANVAMLTGCPASRIPPLLHTAPSRRASPVSWEDAQAGRAPASVEGAAPVAPAVAPAKKK